LDERGQHPAGDLGPGTIFAGEFRVERLIGRGGMGVVYAVEQLATGKVRALKVLSPTLLGDADSEARFLKEARAASRVESDHIVEVVDAGCDRATGMPWLLMELLRGQALSEILAEGARLPPPRALEIFHQLRHGLSAAHRAGLVHRDIKPENVFLADARREGVPFTVKVLDFGIAKLVDSSISRAAPTLSVGSPLWMAPEQTEPGEVRPAADVWALGLLAFRVLSGKPYWLAASAPEGPSIAAVLAEMLLRPLPAASERAAELGVGDLPAGFDAWFSRCVVRDVRARYADAGLCLGPLEAVLGGEAPLDAPGVSRLAGEADLETTLPPEVASTLKAELEGTGPGPAVQEAAVVAAAAGAAGQPAPRARSRLAVALLSILVVAALLGVALVAGPRLWMAQPLPRTDASPRVVAPQPPTRSTSSPPALAVPASQRALSSSQPTPSSGPAAGIVEKRARRARRPVLSAAARQFLHGVVIPCWEGNMSRRAITVDMHVELRQGGGVENVKIDEPPGEQAFRGCVVRRGTERFRLQPPPASPTVAVKARLPLQSR
jgi:serine/threonine protein kinase